MTRAALILKVGFVCLLFFVGGFGCGSKKVAKQPPTTTQLWKIGWAYVKATDNNGSPPQNKDDLWPYLLKQGENNQEGAGNQEKQKEDPADIFRSLGDGEEFVILWGVDFRTYNLGGDLSESPVIAYEKIGQDGKRFVLQFRKVSLVTDAELANLPFPKGQKGP